MLLLNHSCEPNGRTVKYHREQVRAAFGFREFARGDEDKLAGEVCPVELRDEQLREALLVRCRAERIEPPGRIDRFVGSARAAFEKRFCELTRPAWTRSVPTVWRPCSATSPFLGGVGCWPS